MGKPYSMDLRERLVAYVEAGHSCRSAARVFAVGASTAVRLAAAQRERGDVSPKPQGRAPGVAGKLAGALVEAHGAKVQLSSLHRALRRAGTSYRKGLIAAERERAELRRRRQGLGATAARDARAPAPLGLPR